MMQKQSYRITGMRQDNLVGTGSSKGFAHEIMNMRLNTIDDFTSAVWTTEKGTKKLTVEKYGKYWFGDIDGDISFNDDNFEDLIPIGQATINNIWVLFCKAPSKDYIITLQYNNDILGGAILFKGNLNFDYKHPIETLIFYENEQIQKVYWTDGLNQPRVINIADTKIKQEQNTQFDFVQEVSLNENVTVTKLQLGQGLFPPCSVKYAITYYRKYGAETNIVWTSPLYYPTIGNRACSPEEISSDSFKIKVNNLDTEHNFDYIRLYSILRTSADATPIVRIVEDRPIPVDDDFVEFIDTNTKGEIIDPSIIQYLGGQEIIAETLDQKDNTLFLGNITLKQASLSNLDFDLNTPETVFFNDENKKLIPRVNQLDFYSFPSFPSLQQSNEPLYSYHNEMNPCIISVGGYHPNYTYYGNSNNFKTFKTGEIYRFGFQAQNNKGIWSDIVYITDSKFDLKPVLSDDGTYYKVGYAKVTLPTDVVETLYNNNYRKVRLCCCYPTIGERRVLAQGIISPTIRNLKNEKDHTPDRMASWFFRTTISNDQLLFNEIQSRVADYEDISTPSTNNSNYWTATDILTLNSPDIELDESIRTLDLTGAAINKVGTATLDQYADAIYLEATSPAPNNMGVKNTGLSKNIVSGSYSSLNGSDYHQKGTGKFAVWNDCDVYYCIGGNSKVAYPIYPFHRNSSLNNYIKDLDWKANNNPADQADSGTIFIRQHAKLQSKVMSYFIVSKHTKFNLNNSISGSYYQWFDSNEVIPTLLNNTVYYGNVNTIASIIDLPTELGDISKFSDTIPKREGRDTPDKTFTTTGAYKIYKYENGNLKTKFRPHDEKDNMEYWCNDPVPITYKSTPHLVFKASTDISTNNELLVAELVRSRVGRNPSNLTDVYLPCGPAVKLTLGQGCTMYGLEGDSYLMRYDCLKTYSYTPEDVNQIVDIASIMCETRVNLDGRYDRNRGLTDNTAISPTNFNLINKSYSQTDNLFPYFRLDDLAASLDKFSNQFTWSNPKVSGEEVDAWTNVTLTSVADADGVRGAITKIIQDKDRLYLFQEHGISLINFNESTALATDKGLPLELAKTGKYTGLQYLTTDMGCQNKWSISLSKNGLMFIDDSRQELLTFTNDSGIQSLSTTHGFDAFMIQQLPQNFEIWDSLDRNNFVTYYDKLSNDIYYITKNNCLAFNEQTGTFTSFYNYEDVAYMTNLGTHSLMWNRGVWAARELDKYSNFFGTNKPYWITIVCDGQVDDGSVFPADKVFNNIEYRADVFNPDGTNSTINEPVFNKKAAWNGYQMYKEFSLDGVRKFNIWRVQLPRATYNISGVLTTTRDRIRNPFCYIKLLNDDVSTKNRIILHDLAVTFDIK